MESEEGRTKPVQPEWVAIGTVPVDLYEADGFVVTFREGMFSMEDADGNRFVVDRPLGGTGIELTAYLAGGDMVQRRLELRPMAEAMFKDILKARGKATKQPAPTPEHP